MTLVGLHGHGQQVRTSRSDDRFKETVMAAQMYYDDAADLALIRGKKVAIIGYGSQGHAHALNLKDSGVERAGRPAGDEPVARRRRRRRADGRRRRPRSSKWADVIMILVARHERRRKVYNDEIAPNLHAGQDADVRARLQHPLRHDRAAPGRRRRDGRAEVAGPPRPRAVRRRRRHAGAVRRPSGRDRQGARASRCRTRRASA